MTDGFSHKPPGRCKPEEVALKSLFLGPQAENGNWVLEQTTLLLERWIQWRKSQYPADGRAISETDLETPEFRALREKSAAQLNELMRRFEDEVPKFSPRYISHMFSEISLPALFGHIVSLIHNPNNISRETSSTGVHIENEAIAELFQMLGTPSGPSNGSGHFTSGGTVANFEAMLRAKLRLLHWMDLHGKQSTPPAKSIFQAAHCGWEIAQKLKQTLQGSLEFESDSLCPAAYSRWVESRFGTAFEGPVLLVPESKHYSWVKGCTLLGLGKSSLWPIALDTDGTLLISDLEYKIRKAQKENRPILMVVSIAGTTELGQIDPVDDVQNLLDRLREKEGIHLWHHVDAAYGGFFATMNSKLEETLGAPAAAAIRSIVRANSVTLDPHKLGYVPYSCGAFLAREVQDYTVDTKIDAPYVNFNLQIDKGPFTLEGSRSAAGAAATWMIARSIGLNEKGYGALLERTVKTLRQLELKLSQSADQIHLRVAPGTKSNILCFSLAREGEALSHSNQRTLHIYEQLSNTKNNPPFYVSKTRLSWMSYGAYLDQFTRQWKADVDTDHLVLIRVCMMNPFFDSKEMNVSFSDEFVKTIHALSC